jgi:hypothetical protein
MRAQKIRGMRAARQRFNKTAFHNKAAIPN